MLHNHKKLSDFKSQQDPTKLLFSEADLQKTLILDDTYLAVDDKEHLISSKKFLKFADSCPLAPPQKREAWYFYWYPTDLTFP